MESKSRACQSHKMEKYRNKLSNICSDRKTTRHASRQYNYLSMCDNSHPYAKTYEERIMLPVKNKVNNKKKKKKSANNANTDNRRMTGNVNIYICSEAKDNNQEKNKKKLLLSTDTMTSSNTTTEQLNTRSASISSCKLITSIREKRKKLQAQQLSNPIHKKCNCDNNICENPTLCRTSVKESSESSKEQMNISDNDIECKETISSIRNSCCFKDTSFSTMNVEQDLSDSAVPCSDSSVCDNFKPLQSCTIIYPSEARATLNDSDATLLNAICTNVEERNYCKNDPQRNNVCKNNSEYTVCHAVDGSRWLPKSIYTDCATYDKVSKECNVDRCKYRNKKLQDSILNRNNVWKKQIEHKLFQQPLKSSQREHPTHQRSTCSCIVEENEDCFTNIDKVERKFPENIYHNAKCLEKISVCQTSCSKLTETAIACKILFNTTGERVEQTQTCESMFEDSVECLKDKYNNNNIKVSVCQKSSSELNKNSTICETVSFSVAKDRFEKMQICKSTFENSVKCREGTAMYETTFGNSEEFPEITRVCKEFVIEESPEDITVCRRMFGESKGPSEEVIVCKALHDAKEAPKETICKKISDPNLVNQNNDKKVFLNDAKDNLVKKNTNSSNLNIQKKNSGNAKRMVQLDNNFNVAFNNFTEQKSVNDIKPDERIKETISNNLSKVSTAPVGSIKDSFSEPLSKIMHSVILPQTQLYDRSNLSNHNEKETWKIILDNERKTTRMQLSSNQPKRDHFQQLGKDSIARDSVSDKVDQSAEKTQEELKKEESQDISKQRRMTEEKPKDSFLNRSFRRLIDVIKLGRMKIKERTEMVKSKPEKIIANDIKHIGKSDTAFKIKDKIINAIESQKINEKMTIPVKHPLTSKEMIKKAKGVVRPKPIAPAADFPVEIKKMIISSTNETTPKLLRIIAAKRLHFPLSVTTVEPKSLEYKEEFIPADVIKNKHVEEEIPKEKAILRESISAEIVKEIKAEELITPEVKVAQVETNIKDILKDAADIPKVIDVTVIDKNKILKDIDKASEIYVDCSQKKLEKESQKSIFCKSILSSEPKDLACSIGKCTTIDVPCPRKKPKEESSESICYKRELFSDQNKCPFSIAKCNNILEDSFYKDRKFEQRKNYCTYCRLSTIQCTCAPTQYLKNCLKTDKPRFCSMTASHNISSHYCMNCCGIKKEYRKTAVHCQLHEKCEWCTIRNNCSRIIDKCRCTSSVNYINCYRSRDRCCCVMSFAPANCHMVETNYNCKKAMICLYCDNRQDKCTCRAPIEKCPCCELPLDICVCQNDEDHNNNRERIARKPDENRSIRVTSWKPRKEIGRYFARNLQDFRLDSIKECHCYEKPKRQQREELPYQRLNIFSDVMNELQQKMSESVCCSRCWRNPCCCGSQINQDKGKEKKKANNRYHKTERLSRSKSPNNCQSIPKDERKNIVKKLMLVRHVGCVCKLSSCGCMKDRVYERPLAKCYYCKRLPCTCIIAGSPIAEAVQVQ